MNRNVIQLTERPIKLLIVRTTHGKRVYAPEQRKQAEQLAAVAGVTVYEYRGGMLW